MQARRFAVPAVMIVCLGAVTLAQDEELPLSNWIAPPYWSPTVQSAESEPGGAMVAHGQGMQAQAEALPSSPLPFVAIAPCRIVDTRITNPDGFHSPNFADDESRTFSFPNSPDCTGLPATAGAWSINVQFRPISQLSFLTAYPTGTTMPLVSTMTAGPAAWVQNAAIVPAGTSGAIDIYCQYAGRVVIDINGYYGPQSVVTSLNTKIGDVTLAEGTNVTITPSGNMLTIAATAPTGPTGPTGPSGPAGPPGSLPPGTSTQTLYHDASTWVASSALTNDGTNVGVSGILSLPATTATAGQLMLGGTRFLHAWGPFSTFVGQNAGNTTSGGFGGNTAVGFQSLSSISSGISNTAVGSVSLESNTLGVENTALGAGAMRFNTMASVNTAVGLNALEMQSFDNGGISWPSYNTAIGHSALWANQPTANNNGINNTAVGAGSLYSNTVGYNNTAQGAFSLGSNTTAAGNTAIGTGALSSQSFANGGAPWDSFNTAVGAFALTQNQPSSGANGRQNTAIGGASLVSNQIGSENTAVGYESLHQNSTGNFNVALGWQALGGNFTGNGNVAIGHTSAASFNGDNQLFIGNGLGTLIWGDFNTKRVAIGMTGGTYQLQLATDSAGKPGGGSWANSSDARLKRDIRPIEGAVERLLALQGVSFAWIHPKEHGGRDVEQGFIAQDVERVFPEWVHLIEPTGADRELVAPGELVRSLSLPFAFDAMLVEALREQHETITGQQARLAELKRHVEAQQVEIMALKARLAERDRDLERRLAALERNSR